MIQGSRSANNRKDILLNIFLFLLATKFDKSFPLALSDCGSEYRRPEYTDISVDCGTEYINLAIKFCPVIYTGYNESELILNNILNNPDCHATLDTTVLPPVARFRFPINSTNACGSNFVTIRSIGTGVFSDFSNIETVNISGIIRSKDITTGTVTYNAELKYYYSCAYPLEYLINNTQVDVSASSIAVKDNNGSFISTLNLRLFSDINYTQPLVMPPLGIELRTNVFVQVEATNLTSQYFVLLDRCYASISTFPTTRSYFNLFVPCGSDRLTKMLVNGEMQIARFSFSAFRFTEQQNQTVSTYYLHCITRLCEISTCSTFRQCGKRKRRDVVPLTTTPSPNGVTDSRTITSPAIVIRAENVVATKEEEVTISTKTPSDSSVGLGVAVGILAFACIMIVGMGAVFYKRHWHNAPSKMPR
ncbi:zona pellucida-like domain-containing protein 1 [Sinocyclocheilus anshuiensis]|uniref:Zona pellucida-like domain-containing protein 1 n=1 Tax=Sinocyclocheilus anshuiensis TaxID=1608454 RepID=A0A671RXP9_9TELE|nr:PREDICTED: zona pellucida-like domain-containing protein 1 [Sinocyclocheilus anshuiensis]